MGDWTRNLILVLVLLVTVPLVSAQLTIESVDVEVDGRNARNVQDGDIISREAEPGDKLEFEVEVKNNLDDFEIEDVEVRVSIEGLDNGEPLDESSHDFDLREGSDKTISLYFNIPLEAGAGNYLVKVETDGDDENDTEQSDSLELTLVIEKEENDVRVANLELLRDTLSCEDYTQLYLRVINVGEEEEDDVVVRVANDDLDLSFSDTVKLEEGEFDEGMEYARHLAIPLKKNVRPGLYPITATVIFDEGDEVTSDSIDLTVEQCRRPSDPVIIEYTNVVELRADNHGHQPFEVGYRSAAQSNGMHPLLFIVALVALNVFVILGGTLWLLSRD